MSLACAAQISAEGAAVGGFRIHMKNTGNGIHHWLGQNNMELWFSLCGPAVVVDLVLL